MQDKKYLPGIISLDIFHSKIILLHTHTQVRYCMCAKFHQYRFISLGVALTRHMGRQTDGLTDGRTDGWTVRQTDRQTDRQRDRQTDGRTDSQTDGPTNGQTDRQMVDSQDDSPKKTVFAVGYKNHWIWSNFSNLKTISHKISQESQASLSLHLKSPSWSHHKLFPPKLSL